MTDRRATKRRREAGVISFLLAFVLLAGAAGRAAAQGERQFTPEQQQAVTDALALMTQSSAAEREGKLDAAIELRERSQQVIEKAFGPDDMLTALNLPLLA